MLGYFYKQLLATSQGEGYVLLTKHPSLFLQEKPTELKSDYNRLCETLKNWFFLVAN